MDDHHFPLECRPVNIEQLDGVLGHLFVPGDEFLHRLGVGFPLNDGIFMQDGLDLGPGQKEARNEFGRARFHHGGHEHVPRRWGRPFAHQGDGAVSGGEDSKQRHPEDGHRPPDGAQDGMAFLTAVRTGPFYACMPAGHGAHSFAAGFRFGARRFLSDYTSFKKRLSNTVTKL